MKLNWHRLSVVVVGLPLLVAAARADEPPLPSMDTILRNVKEQAEKENAQQRLFKQRYNYTQTKVTEYRNGDGELKKREEKTSVKKTAAPAEADDSTDEAKPGVTDESRPAATDGAVTDTHSNVRGRQFNNKDFLLQDDTLNRFDFTLVGREQLDGRSALVIDLKPGNRKLPERNLKDRFINKAAGRIWVDEADYALAKVDLHLSGRVNVFGGLVGSVGKFLYSFTRTRTDEGIWFTRAVNWHLEGREVWLHRTVDYHEEKKDFQKAQ